MNEKPSTSSLPWTNGNSRLYEILAAEHPSICDAIRICSVPLGLTEALVNELLERFAPDLDVGQFWQLSGGYGLLIQRGEGKWRLDRKTRQYFLAKLEQQNPSLAQQVHAAVLDYTKAHPTLNDDQDRLQQAYHTTPSDEDAGADLYWSAYCRIRASNRFAMLPVLAHLAESQAHWLTDHKQDTILYRATALYYEGPVESRQKAAELLGSILEQGASVPITIDTSFLFGTLQADRDEAARLYEQATELRDRLDLKDREPDVQRHLRLTLAKSFFSLASILQASDDPKELENAENRYRHGIQIVSAVEPAYEATQLRHLIGVLQKRGEEIEGPIQRITQIEHPFRQAFLEEALSRPDDIAYLYYAISALNHGLGYDSQLVRIEVDQNGAAQLEGTFTLRALSMLSRIDTYLETAPESDVGIHFEGLKSLTPTYTLDFKRVIEDNPEAERLEIIIDPPMQPGDQLTYRWTARASEGTFATTPEQLAKAKLDHEYVAWEIIAPMRRLEIQVVIPLEQTQPPPPSWFELWRVGRWRATTQAQTAYRAFLQDDPSRVKWHADIKPPDSLQLHLEADYPWLAMSYVLAWVVSQPVQNRGAR